MQVILPHLINLPKYLISRDTDYRLTYAEELHCSCCGTGSVLYKHGTYSRKPDMPFGKKNKKELLNPILIQRYQCQTCGITISALPECIAPRRWFMWKEQQCVILKYLNGYNWKEISSTTGVSIKTCKRWCKWLLDKYNTYAAELKNVAGNLGDVLRDTTGEFKQFWQKCFAHISLDRAMLLCHQAGVDTP